MKRWTAVLLALLALILLPGCNSGNAMQDGYYSAQAASYLNGWKEFVTLTVKNGQIVAVEYNAENESGFIKSWDNAYMKNMSAITGTYPNEYTRNYASQLLQTQNADEVTAIAGASTSGSSFRLLANAAMSQAKKGDSTIAVVDTQNG